MRIFVAPMAVPNSYSATPQFREFAARSRDRRHEAVESPEDADVCLFVDCHNLEDPIVLSRIWSTDTFRRYRHKCYVYDQRPRAYCNLPGVYASVPLWALRPAYQIPWGYQRIDDPRIYLGQHELAGTEPDLLFSFVGSGSSHRCRRPLLELRHPRAVVKRVDGHVNWEPNQPGYAERRADFARTTLRSKFVLCPRGRATSSIRFYEAMALGRVPVVIADDWVAPKGLDLESFAIRWPESSSHRLVEYLESREADAESMGAAAQQIYEENFAPEVTFDRVGDLLADVVATDPWAHFPRHGFPPDRRIVRHVFGRGRKILRKLR